MGGLIGHNWEKLLGKQSKKFETNEGGGGDGFLRSDECVSQRIFGY